MFKPFSFIVSSDIHLGVSTWGGINPVTGLNRMTEKINNEFNKTCQKVVDLRAKYWVITGDVFHSRTPSNAVRAVFTRGIKTVLDAGIEIIICLGNHDILTSLGTDDSLAEIRGLKLPGLIISDQSDVIPKTDVIFLSLPWEKSSQEIITKANEMKSVARLHLGSVPVFMLGHFSVEGAVPGTERDFEISEDFPVPLEAIIGPEITYTFLGHIHKRQELGKKAMYTGSMDRISMAERGELKGSTLVTVNSATDIKLEFLEGTPQTFVQYEIDLKDGGIDQQKINWEDSAGAVVKLKITATQDQMKLFDHVLVNEKLAGALFVMPIDWSIRRQNEDRRLNAVQLEEGKDYLESYLESQVYMPEIKARVIAAAKTLIKQGAE
jgi:exonuclease SbcD